MELGDEWIYRLRVSSPSERVRILDIEQRKQTVRVDVEFSMASGRVFVTTCRGAASMGHGAG
jgi:hypothetical protein